MRPLLPLRSMLHERPLLSLAVLLVIASRAGAALAQGSPDARPAAVLGACLLVALVLSRCAPAWVLLLALLGALRGGLAERPAPAHTALEHETALVGRWRGTGGRRGLVEGPRERSGLLFELALPPPPDGTWVAVLPGEAPIPWPRGPVAGPAAGTARGIVRVHPDELVCAPLPATRIEELGTALRARLGARVRGLESPGPAAGLVRALLLGDRREVDGETLDLFTRTGVRHLLALSGLHVGLLAVCVLLPLARLAGRFLPGSLEARRRHAPRLELALRLGLLAGFVWVVGARDPVTRAAAAIALAWLAPALPSGGPFPGRRADPLSVWGLALSLETLADPRGLESVSLRLSYLATLGILLGTGPIRRGLRALVPLEVPAWIPRSWPVLLALASGERLGKASSTALAASIAAVLATLPESAARFGEAAPVGIVATPLLIPLLVPLLAGGWCALLLPPSAVDSVPPFLAEAMVALLELVDRLPGTPAPLPPRPLLLTASLVTLCFGALRARGSLGEPLRRAACLAGALWLFPWSAAPRGLELHVLDVGHGNASVLRAPGVPALVFDAGSRDRPALFEEALSPLLRTWDVRRPWVGLSHDHVDHSSALARLVERHPPALWLGALPQVVGERLAHDVRRLDPAAGRLEIATGGPLGLALVRGAEREGNEGSRALELFWDGRRALLTGDAEEEGFAVALAQGWLRAPLWMLLLPHHGSDFELLGAVLERLRPELVWCSASGPPALAAEIERRALPWAWTGRDGPLALTLP